MRIYTYEKAQYQYVNVTPNWLTIKYDSKISLFSNTIRKEIKSTFAGGFQVK